MAKKKGSLHNELAEKLIQGPNNIHINISVQESMEEMIRSSLKNDRHFLVDFGYV